MEEEKSLYPISLCSIKDEYCWGYEEFKLADLGYRDSLVRSGWLAGNSISEIMDTYMDRVVGDNVYEYYGRQFPIQLKIIHIKGKMPLRVSPDDEVAAERYDLLGKEKMWYIADAPKDARLYLGFARDTDASSFLESCTDGSIPKMLNTVVPATGEYFHISPGIIHGASGEMTIIEVSESSPLDFCVHSWGREVSDEEFDPALTLIDALDFIDYKAASVKAAKVKPGVKPVPMLDLKEFSTAMADLVSPLRIYSESAESFSVYFCVDGAATIQLDVLGAKADFNFRKGECILVPAECLEFTMLPLEKDTRIMEVSVLQRSEPDPYINPDAPEAAPDDSYAS